MNLIHNAEQHGTNKNNFFTKVYKRTNVGALFENWIARAINLNLKREIRKNKDKNSQTLYKVIVAGFDSLQPT